MGETQRHEGYHLISEYIDTQKEVDRLDAIIEEKQAEIEEKQRQVEKLVRRQEELALVLGPALQKSGPIEWRDGYTIYMVEDAVNETLLNVVKLESPLAVKLPMFTDEQIRESIAHDLAADFVVTEDDGELEDFLDDDVISIPAGVEAVYYPVGKTVHVTLGVRGREPVIANGVAVRDQATS